MLLDGIHLFKVNNKNARAMCEICSVLTIKTQNGIPDGVILSKRETSKGAFLSILQNFKNTFFTEHLQAATSVYLGGNGRVGLNVSHFKK